MRVFARQLDLTGGEGVGAGGWGLAPGPAAAAVVCLDAREGAGSTSADGGDGGAERRPSGRNGRDDGRHGRYDRGDASQEGALPRPLEGLSDPHGGPPGRLIGVGGGVGGLRRSRQRRREVAPRGGGTVLCWRLGGRRHGVNPQDNTRGAQKRTGLDTGVIPASNSLPKEALGCDIGPLEGAAALLLVEQSLNEKPS